MGVLPAKTTAGALFEAVARLGKIDLVVNGQPEIRDTSSRMFEDKGGFEWARL